MTQAPSPQERVSEEHQQIAVWVTSQSELSSNSISSLKLAPSLGEDKKDIFRNSYLDSLPFIRSECYMDEVPHSAVQNVWHLQGD